MTTADTLVNEALFGVPEIKHEPQNYYLHRDTFLRTVQRAIEAERSACAKVAEEYGIARYLYEAEGNGGKQDAKTAAEAIASLIRGRGEK